LTGAVDLVAATELTIATGIITVTQSVHKIDTEADAASDDLVTINGGSNEQLLLIRAEHADRTVVVKETGNILLGGADVTLDNTNKYLLLIYDSGLSKWVIAGGSGSASAYKTIYIKASSMDSTATNGATFSTNEYATNDINESFLEFDGATEEFAEFSFPMPEDWDLGTIKAKFYWTSATGSSATDTVEWEIAAGALSNDDAIDAALGTAQVISDALLADNGTDMQISDATPAITIGGTPALADLVHFKVSRNVSGTDNMTEDAWLFGVRIQYKADKTPAAW
jgi:hypothetical protein